MRSMTGFGRGEARSERFHATVEARSVNNRFCEVRVRTPRLLAEFESEATSIVKTALSRGKIDVAIQITQQEEADLGLGVNVPVARAYARLLADLIDVTGIEDRVQLSHLQTFPEIFDREPEGDQDAAACWEVAREALERAISALQAMREQEGEALRQDLALRLATITSELDAIETRSPERLVEARTRLHDRVRDLLGDERLNPERLELEIVLLADRLDVSEECVRLRSHIAQFAEALELDEPVGRRLNFVTQEMNREVNTIGSKANDAEIARRAVVMKEALEQIREQVSNVQ